MDTENKQWWCKHGCDLERQFVAEVCPRIGLECVINPQKLKDKYAPDLLLYGHLADLKTQFTPFFTASKHKKPNGVRYDPANTVTFNEKDYLRYSELYPDIDILFWASWGSVHKFDTYVPKIDGVWYIRFKDLAAIIERGDVSKHRYRNRETDTKGNAKASYLIDLGDLHRIDTFK